MITDYTHSVLIAVRAEMVDDANHLACLMGESGADINTFSYANFHDSNGEKFAVSATSVKPIFLSPTQTGALPTTPQHAIGIIDRDKAQRAFDSLNKPGGVRMIVDVPFSEALEQLALTRIPSTEEA